MIVKTGKTKVLPGKVCARVNQCTGRRVCFIKGLGNCNIAQSVVVPRKSKKMWYVARDLMDFLRTTKSQPLAQQTSIRALLL